MCLTNLFLMDPCLIACSCQSASSLVHLAVLSPVIWFSLNVVLECFLVLLCLCYRSLVQIAYLDNLQEYVKHILGLARSFVVFWRQTSWFSTIRLSLRLCCHLLHCSRSSTHHLADTTLALPASQHCASSRLATISQVMRAQALEEIVNQNVVIFLNFVVKQ